VNNRTNRPWARYASMALVFVLIFVIILIATSK
jgi:hypothetical protein